MRLGRVRSVHFVGIGGIGMSGIAEVLLTLGYEVSGSDLRASETTRRLESLGGRVRIGHDAIHVGHADVVVVSSAVRPDNPEVTAAHARHVPVIPRAEMLAELMRMKYGVAVAGSHGKTTTTSLVAHVLGHAGLDPTVVIGGKVNALGAGARLGQGEYLVAEADESDGTFLHLSPTIAVVTNIDREHLDHYRDFGALRDAFARFVERVPFWGLAVLCVDHPEVRAMQRDLERRHVSYGLTEDASFSARRLRHDGLETRFDVVRDGSTLGSVSLHMPGAHNVQNALAAFAVAEELEVPFDVVRDALAAFRGVDRRFTVRGEGRGVLVVDDYGHHPEEIRATLAAARAAFSRRLVVAFQPHRYTRTRDLWREFVDVFGGADALAVVPVYAAGEEPIAGVDSPALVRDLVAAGRPAEFVPRAEIVPWLAARARPGDLVLLLGAGDIGQAAAELLGRLGGP
jgi:UDP-N-acetylmuramate--alanine ligase